jgi:hypothetical protein
LISLILLAYHSDISFSRNDAAGSDESNGEDATAVMEPAGRDSDEDCCLRPG